MRALQVFVVAGAVLLFMLQPLVGRMLLPVHGGSFQVWTTCMLFFQLALLAGYAYAHLLLPRLGRLHRVLLVLSLPCAMLPLELLPVHAGSIVDILLALTLGVALPFVVLSTTSIVAQVRASLLPEPEHAYSLYAWSNLGSLLGLLSYPLVLELWLGLDAQRALWAALYLGYVVMAYRVTPTRWPLPASDAPSERIPRARMAYWTLLSTGACTVLLGLTNVLSLGAGSVPLIWVFTLAAYLLGFVAAFARDPGPWSRLHALWPEAALLALFAYHEVSWLEAMFSELGLLVLQLLCLFVVTFGVNAELYRTRPALRGLTAFYLCIATGGALGGVLVGIVAPLVLDDLYEYPLGLVLVALTFAVGRRHALRSWLLERSSWASGERLHAARWLRALVLLALAVYACVPFYTQTRPKLALRNFYGLFAIWEYDRTQDDDGLPRSIRILSHNGTNHGFQSLRDEERCTPTGYFHRASPLGELLGALPSPRRAAVIGLGTGTIATYFDAQDALTFYELDADTLELARTHFDFIERCRAKPRVVLGDARVQLARDAALRDGSLDVLIVDAFSGDSIPFHLLTREAIALYQRKLASSGVLVFHVSSRFYALWPTIAATTHALGLHSAQRVVRQSYELGPLAWSSQYVVASRDAARLDQLATRGWVLATDFGAEVWTDDRVSLLPALFRRLATR